MILETAAAISGVRPGASAVAVVMPARKLVLRFTGDLRSPIVAPSRGVGLLGSIGEQETFEREIGDRRNEAASLDSIGFAYQGLGEFDRALDSYEQALRIQRTFGPGRSASGDK